MWSRMPPPWSPRSSRSAARRSRSRCPRSCRCSRATAHGCRPHPLHAHASRGDSPMKVLVADDDADLRELIAFTLMQAGHLVVKAGDGPAALRHFGAEGPDLVLLDINMPGLSGFQVCE